MLAHWLQVQTRLPFKRVDRTCSSAGNLLQRDHFVLYCTSSEPLLSALSMRSILDFKVSPAGGKHLGVNLSTLEDMSPFMWGFFLYKYIYWCGKIVSLGMNRKDEKDSSRCLDGQLYPSIAKKKKIICNQHGVHQINPADSLSQAIHPCDNISASSSCSLYAIYVRFGHSSIKICTISLLGFDCYTKPGTCGRQNSWLKHEGTFIY